MEEFAFGQDIFGAQVFDPMTPLLMVEVRCQTLSLSRSGHRRQAL